MPDTHHPGWAAIVQLAVHRAHPPHPVAIDVRIFPTATSTRSTGAVLQKKSLCRDIWTGPHRPAIQTSPPSNLHCPISNRSIGTGRRFRKAICRINPQSTIHNPQSTIPKVFSSRLTVHPSTQVVLGPQPATIVTRDGEDFPCPPNARSATGSDYSLLAPSAPCPGFPRDSFRILMAFIDVNRSHCMALKRNCS